MGRVDVLVDVDEGDDKEETVKTVRTTLAKGKRQSRRVRFAVRTLRQVPKGWFKFSGILAKSFAK